MTLTQARVHSSRQHGHRQEVARCQSCWRISQQTHLSKRLKVESVASQTSELIETMVSAPNCGFRCAAWLEICKAAGAQCKDGCRALRCIAHHTAHLRHDPQHISSPHTWNLATRKHTKELTPTPNCVSVGP